MHEREKQFKAIKKPATPTLFNAYNAYEPFCPDCGADLWLKRGVHARYFCIYCGWQEESCPTLEEIKGHKPTHEQANRAIYRSNRAIRVWNHALSVKAL